MLVLKFFFIQATKIDTWRLNIPMYISINVARCASTKWKINRLCLQFLLFSFCIVLDHVKCGYVTAICVSVPSSNSYMRAWPVRRVLPPS